MQNGTVTRNDSFWQGHPDVVYFHGYFYVVFRQSQKHRESGKTQVMLTRSRTGFKYSAPICISESIDRYNCPRLSVVNDQLYIICDLVKQSEDFIGSEQSEDNTSIILWTSCNGLDWSSPIKTNIKGIVPDKICPTNDGGFLLATHTSEKTEYGSHLVQNVWKTMSVPQASNWAKYNIANNIDKNLCEATICNTGNELICLMRENSQKGEPCYLSFSLDNGNNWSNIMSTRIFGCHRPVLGQLQSGNFLITYREQSFLHLPSSWAKNTFACLIPAGSLKNKELPCAKGIILPIDHDNNIKSDSGYTGWTLTEDGQIYIVNYITKDAPKPYIKWYLIDESDF
jgi:sialidase-1